MSTPPAPAPTPPSWPHCGHGANPATDPVGCPGIHVPGHTACLAHLNDTDRDAYLTGLTPGADIDHRGTTFTPLLLEALLQALHDPTTQKYRLGDARFHQTKFSGLAIFSRAEFSGFAGFSGAQFSGAAQFDQAQFTREARFDQAQFSDLATFDQAQFSGAAQFDQAHFTGLARFGQAQFSGLAGFTNTWFVSDTRFSNARFDSIASFLGAQFADSARFNEVRFSDVAMFGRARFSAGVHFSGAQFSSTAQFTETYVTGDAVFDWATFSGPTRFDEARFAGHVAFVGARFAVMTRFGPVVCSGTVDLSGSLFEVPVTLEIAARDEVRCVRTRWESTATLRLRYATVDLSHAVLLFPVAVNAHPAPFIDIETGTTVAEELLRTSESGVRVVSVRGVDAAHLMLTDTDLSNCLFAGAFHLDQLRLEGRCTFAPTPNGPRHRHHIWLCRWSRRRTLAEEHHWRAQASGQSAMPPGQAPSPRHWRIGPHHPDPDQTPDPEDVAAIYRQLRKAFEDGKNEPGAADFYYGEMEMRRHDHTGTPPGERGLVWGYWLLSGYGLRALRALGWLVAAVAVTIVFIMGLGLPDSSPKQTATGTIPATGGPVTLIVDKPDPQLTLPVGDRFTGERFDQALQVVLNSVVFRSSGQDLTTWGTYTEMVSRFTEPALLALAVLAMRSRIKR
ncbi:pentapeptide repeat-containing protein [Streptomyces sp. NPDC004542]|uniref:pentapeptide repeat-containing protein n=1 Tax=Streptomyces sp. NPDC004542 TaxID=3154281 RepID=UPI0033AB6E7D